MYLVQVDSLHAESLEAGVATLLNVLTREPAHVWLLGQREIHLRRDNAFLEIRKLPERPSGDLLADSHRIHVGRVEEIDAAFDRGPEKGRACPSSRTHGRHFGSP